MSLIDVAPAVVTVAAKQAQNTATRTHGNMTIAQNTGRRYAYEVCVSRLSTAAYCLLCQFPRINRRGVLDGRSRRVLGGA